MFVNQEDIFHLLKYKGLYFLYSVISFQKWFLRSIYECYLSMKIKIFIVS